VPSLGGQPTYYLTIQLFMFRERLRVAEPMTEMLRGVSDADLRGLAELIAKLPPPRPATEGLDRPRMTRAREIVAQQRCNFCHGTDYAGEQNVPRLASQREDYLVKALRDYKGNTRRGYDASMADVLYGVSEAEILDLAYFLARLP
jgi:cytochrome c553